MPMPREIQHVVKFKNLFNQAMWEIPEIVLSSGMALIGVALGFIGLRNYALNDGEHREYKMTYVVMRSDDPRSTRLKNPVHTAYKN